MTLHLIHAALALLGISASLLPASPVWADQVRNSQWHLRYLDIAQANRISQGAGVTVAVIDSGVYPHADLRNNLLAGIDLVPGGSGDGRGDVDGHGTGMAGLIAAHGMNGGDGALGVAPKAKILPIRDSITEDPAEPDALARGINFAVDRGAKVINISTTGASSVALVNAVNAAFAADVIVVAGAGNRPRSSIIGSPARLDGVVAVGATDRSGNRAAISVAGRQMMLAAPGVEIVSTSISGKYRRGTGTSDSTAIVAGAAALVRSRFPNLSAEEVVHRLTATAIDKGPPGRDDEYGYGVLNIVGALTADVPPLAGASPSVTDATPSEADPSLVAATPMPRDPTGVRGKPVYLAVGVLVVAALVVTLLLLRARRPPPADQV